MKKARIEDTGTSQLVPAPPGQWMRVRGGMNREEFGAEGGCAIIGGEIPFAPYFPRDFGLTTGRYHTDSPLFTITSIESSCLSTGLRSF